MIVGAYWISLPSRAYAACGRKAVHRSQSEDVCCTELRIADFRLRSKRRVLASLVPEQGKLERNSGDWEPKKRRMAGSARHRIPIEIRKLAAYISFTQPRTTAIVQNDSGSETAVKMETIRKDAIAVAGAAALFLVGSIIGFTPLYFGPLLAGNFESPSTWMHAHVIFSLLWLILFLVQPVLILRRTLDRHRMLGRIALFVALATAYTGFAIQFDMLPVTPGDLGNVAAFTARFTAGLGIFVPAVIAAVVYRRRTAWHLRLMYLATMSLMPSPFGRILIHYIGVPFDAAGPIIGLFNVLLAAALPIYDKLVHGKVERISWIALGAVFFAGLLIAVLSNNEDWARLMSGQ